MYLIQFRPPNHTIEKLITKIYYLRIQYFFPIMKLNAIHTNHVFTNQNHFAPFSPSSLQTGRTLDLLDAPSPPNFPLEGYLVAAGSNLPTYLVGKRVGRP